MSGPDPAMGSGSALRTVTGADRWSQFATPVLAALTGAAAWLSAGTVAYTSGGADRVAALPPTSYLVAAMVLAIIAAIIARLRLHEAWPMTLSLVLFLPYLPGSIPAAFMMWQGPIEAIVWLLVAAGLVMARGGAWRPHALAAFADQAKAPWIAGALVIALALIAFNQVRLVVPGGDEPHYLVATQSLIADGDLKVENNYAAGDYLEYFSGRLQPHFLQRSARGEIYSIHAPGVSLIVLPAFLIAGYIGAVFTVAAIAGLAAALTWMVAWRLTRSAPAAWAGVVSVFATAPFLFHTFTIYPDGIGALMVIAAVWLVASLDDTELPQPLVFVSVGAGLAILPWLHTRFALLAAVFGAAVIARLVMRRAPAISAAAFLIVPIAAAAAWFAFFWMIWGTPSPLAPYGRDTESSVSYIARGVIGLLVDQQHGVIGTAPVYVVAVLGWRALLRQRRALVLTLTAAAVIYLGAVSSYAMWWGGVSAPARFAAATLPIAAVLIAAAWSAYPRLRTAMLLLLIVSVALLVPRVTEESGRFVFNSRNAFDPTIEWLSQNVDLSLALPSDHRDRPALALRDGLPWLVAIAIVLGSSIAVSRRGAGMAAAWTLVSACSLVSAMAVPAIVWAAHGAQPITPDRSMLASLSSHRPWHTTLLDTSRWRSVSREEFFARHALEVETGTSALLRLRKLPAGEYEISGGDARLAMILNRNDPTLESGTLPFRLRLPVAVSTLSVRAESIVPDGVTALRLTPAGLSWPPISRGRAAVRAARYGRARVFAFDERAYLEPAGFWTRAEGRATVVIDADDQARASGLPITITGGAAATTIGISVGESWSQSYSMTPGEKREVLLPPLDGAPAWVVSIHSGPGFRPFEREPGNPDVRLLAAWFEIP